MLTDFLFLKFELVSLLLKDLLVFLLILFKAFCLEIIEIAVMKLKRLPLTRLTSHLNCNIFLGIFAIRQCLKNQI